MNEEHDLMPRDRKAKDDLKSKGEPLFAEIESLVQQRLWSVTQLEDKS